MMDWITIIPIRQPIMIRPMITISAEMMATPLHQIGMLMEPQQPVLQLQLVTTMSGYLVLHQMPI